MQETLIIDQSGRILGIAYFAVPSRSLAHGHIDVPIPRKVDWAQRARSPIHNVHFRVEEKIVYIADPLNLSPDRRYLFLVADRVPTEFWTREDVVEFKFDHTFTTVYHNVKEHIEVSQKDGLLAGDVAVFNLGELLIVQAGVLDDMGVEVQFRAYEPDRTGKLWARVWENGGEESHLVDPKVLRRR